MPETNVYFGSVLSWLVTPWPPIQHSGLHPLRIEGGGEAPTFEDIGAANVAAVTIHSPALAGPERLEIDSWDDETTRRDYYAAETTQEPSAWVSDGNRALGAAVHSCRESGIRP